jgi:tripartite-type tricarboxylate transporter receptor subunit TctC
MNSRRRIFTAALALAAATLASAAFAQAPQFPSKPIKFIVPFSAGGAADILARVVGQHVGESLGQPVVVENKPGAGGGIAADYVARSDPDGYTLFVGSTGPLAINKSLYSKLSYDPAKDFAAVSLAVLVQNVLVVGPSVTVTSVQDVIARARGKPGGMTYASSGNGTSLHLAGELFKTMAKVDLVHVPYKGGAPAITDLIGGQVDMMFAVLPDAMPYIKSGKLRALAVAGTARSKSLPDVPTVFEAGVPGYEASAWYGFVAPAKTPPDIVRKLNAAINAALAKPEAQERLAALGFEVVASTPQQFTAKIESEIAKWAAVVQASGARVD